MRSFLAGLQTWWAATGLAAVFPGGLRLSRADDTTAKPYLVATVITAPASPRFGGEKPYELQVQFDAVGLDLAGDGSIGAALEQFTTLLEGSTLATDGEDLVYGLRCTIEPMPFEDEDIKELRRGGGVRGLSRWMCEYVFSIQPTR